MNQFIICFLKYKKLIDNNFLLDLIGNWKNKMSGCLAMPLLYRMFSIFNILKIRKNFIQYKNNFDNFNNILYNSLLIFEYLDNDCDGELNKKDSYTAYKKLYKLYYKLLPNINQLKLFRSKLNSFKTLKFMDWINLITNNNLLNTKLFQTFDKFKKKQITLCQRCNGLMFLKKTNECYNNQELICDFSLKKVKGYVLNCSNKKHDLHPFGYDIDFNKHDIYFEDLLNRRLENKIYNKVIEQKKFLNNIKCFKCLKIILKSDDAIYIDKYENKLNLDSHKNFNFFCETCINTFDILDNKNYIDNQVIILKNEVKNINDSLKKNNIISEINKLKALKPSHNFLLFDIDSTDKFKNKLELIRSLLLDRSMLYFKNTIFDIRNQYLSNNQINSLQNYIISIKRILSSSKLWNFKFMDYCRIINKKINVNFKNLIESMSLENNIFKSESEKDIAINKIRKEFNNLNIDIKENLDYLDTLDLILFEINKIDKSNSVIKIINKVDNFYNEFYTNIESLEKSTPLNNIQELIYVNQLNEDTQCMICLEKMECIQKLAKIKGCNHVFHFSCIEKWLIVFNNCPLCRN